MIYQILKKGMFSLDPEKAHHLGIKGINFLCGTPLISQLSKWNFQYQHSMLEQEIFGLAFKNPVGLAAGFDKYCDFYKHFESLGFGFGEIGTITPIAQEGNPSPRLFRDVPNKAILNRMGFNNGGMEHCLKTIYKKGLPNIPLVVNIGKNKITPNDKASDDYKTLIENLTPVASFFTVNISSPNTPGLRNLQAKDDLQKLLDPVLETNDKIGQKPIALKISPDVTESEVDDIVEVALKSKLSAIITTNTTIQKDQIASHLQDEMGGVSGQPVQKASNQVLRWVAERAEKKTKIIGVGGIFNAQDAYEKIKLGADLVEIYTGWIYGGPAVVSEINKGLVALLKKDGHQHISEAIGKELNN